MAMPVQPINIGIDVAKQKLDLYRDDSGTHEILQNTRKDIRRWLTTLPKHAELAVEATGTYHVELVEMAYAKGFRVYVVDGYQLSHYRKGIGGRAKTDRTDASLLARYLRSERDELRAWAPPKGPYRQIQMLLTRRAKLVKASVMLNQSLSGIKGLQAGLSALKRQIDRLDQQIEKHLRALMRESDLMTDVLRCQAIEGVGFLTATALVMANLRGDFKDSDAFIAFLGLDVRVRDSGKQVGRRKLTKKGSSEIRRLLHNAAMAAKRSQTWSGYFDRYVARGLSKTQALVILARKLARVAFSLLKNQSEYRPEIAVPA